MISTAIQDGSWVRVYGDGNIQLFSRYGQLTGYTSGTVSIREGDYVKTYDAKGVQVSSHYSK